MQEVKAAAYLKHRQKNVSGWTTNVFDLNFGHRHLKSAASTYAHYASLV